MARKIDYIVQLRGLAAFAVVCFHSLISSDANSLNACLRVARTICIHGWVGVYIFFAISGWCIAQRIADAFDRKESTLVYSLDRVLRIFPTYWSVLALALLMLAAAAPINGIPLSRNLPHQPTEWLANFALVQPAFGYGSFLFVSWTLFNELSFYAAGAVALVVRRFGFSAKVLLLAGGLACLIISWHPPSGLLVGFSLWPDFFIGMLAWWLVSRKADITWIAALIFTLVSLAREPAEIGLVALGTALFLAVATWHPPKLPDFIHRWLMALGAASYSIYLVHVPVMSPFYNLAARFVSPLSSLSILIWIAGVCLALAAGITVHNAVEVPFERWRHHALAARILLKAQSSGLKI
jgi:peptidoglycan/LPS O-acetylase OafA/YrhL